MKTPTHLYSDETLTKHFPTQAFSMQKYSQTLYGKEETITVKTPHVIKDLDPRM